MMHERVNLTFTERYDRDLEKLGSVRSSTAASINESVRAAIESTWHNEELLRLDNESAELAPGVNDAILAQENMSRADMEAGRLPAYVSDRVTWPEPEVRSDEDVQRDVDDLWDRLYESAYHVDSVLDEQSREDLGEGYAKYAAERDAEASREAMAEFEAARRENGVRSTRIDRQTGESHLSLTGEDGMASDDPYAFDEYS